MLKSLKRKDIDRIIALLEEARASRGPGPSIVNARSMDLKEIYNDPHRDNLNKELMALNRGARSELIGVMLLGRDFEGTFDEAKAIGEQQGDDEQVGYITGKTAKLARYLERGWQVVTSRK